MMHEKNICIGKGRTKNAETDSCRSPFEGIGKPEPLKENLSGFWRRRIDEVHRQYMWLKIMQ